MKIMGFSGLLFSVVILWFFSCSPESRTGSLSQTEFPAMVEIEQQPVEKQAWEQEWDKIVTAARKEGKAIIASTAGPAARDALIKAFKDKYGIPLEFMGGGGRELAAKISAERRAGLFLYDIYIGGTTTLTNVMKPAGFLDSLESLLLLPEVTDPKIWWGGGLLFVDKDHTILAFSAHRSTTVAINTDLVNTEEIKSYQDLLKPKFKGKISFMNPLAVGIGRELWFRVMVEVLGEDYFRELAKQGVEIMYDERLQAEWLARGKYPIILAPKTNPMAELRRAGVPVKEIYLPGGYLSSGSGNVASINRAPHPNAVRVFINWLLTKEAQYLFNQAYGSQSARLDVPADYLEPASLRDPVAKYFWIQTEEFLKTEGARVALAKEIFNLK